MKNSFYLRFLSLFFLVGCSSDDDVSTPVDPDPEPPVEETSYYDIPENLVDYYEGVDFFLEEEELKNELAAHTIGKHSTFLSYGQRHNYLYNADEDPDNPDNVILLYSGESRYWKEYLSGSNSYDPQTFNTEHVYPQSMLEGDAPNDLHVMRVADIEVNSLRYNYPFTDGEGRYELIGGNAFYPGDEWRGDVARIIMYMNLRYDEPFEDMGGLDLFLEWNTEDPVSRIEVQRNNVIEDAQGNRNPFIDNPHLATRIWGGEEADNRWDGENEDDDTEAPSVPQNVRVSETGYETISLSWDASSDNESIAKYNIMIDGEFYAGVSGTSTTVKGLSPGTTYNFTISAADTAGNTSEESEAVEGTTVSDDENPSIPQNLAVSAVTATSVSLTWDASTDNVAVEGYNIHINGEFYTTTNNTEYTIAGLSSETTYSFTVAAVDIYGSISDFSIAVEATTNEATEGDANASDIFLSEYIEGSWGFNKALEIANATGNVVDLSEYVLMKITNERENWEDEYQLEGTLANGEVLVIANSKADREGILRVADILIDHGIVNFNGNDPIGLFKNGELIDIIGYPGGEYFAQDVNLRRKAKITSPNPTYTIDEWETYSDENTEGLGNL